MSHNKIYNMHTRGVHGDVDIGGVIDTPPPVTLCACSFHFVKGALCA